MAGASMPSIVGAGYRPYPDEDTPYIVRKHLDTFHVCKRERVGRYWWYRIVADVATQEMANQFISLLKEERS